MKNIVICIIALLVIMGGCKKDKGNYDYSTGEVISQTGLSGSYDLLSQVDTLKINPQAGSTDNGAQFEYLWLLNEVNTLVPFDTLAKTRSLTYPVKKEAGIYTLNLRITNKNTGYSQYFSSKINVATEFTRGWYVAKDDGNQADLDLFLTPGSIVPGTVRTDIYSKVNGSKMPGITNLLNFFPYYTVIVNGKVKIIRSLTFTTDKDAAIIDVGTLKNVNTFSNGLFYETPTVKGPCYTFPGFYSYIMMNNGNLYGISLGDSNGKFGGRMLRDANNATYQLSKYFISNFYSNSYFYDESSTSFVALYGGSISNLSPLSNIAGSDISGSNINKELLYMGLKSINTGGATACILLQDKGNSSLKTLSHVDFSGLSIKISNTATVLPTQQLYSGANFSVIYADENILYFSVNNNQVWSRNLTNQVEKLEYTVPAGEEITFIRHKKYTLETAYAHNFITVGTKVGGDYKIRMFNKASGSITGSPVVILEGKGIPRDVMYLSPSVTETTYSAGW